MSQGRVIGSERHDRHCGHIEEWWERPDNQGIPRLRYYTDCTPDCEEWGGVT